MNIPPEAAAVGFVAMGFAALLGIGAAAVGLFVLRVEFVQVVRRLEAVERRQADGE